MEGQVFDVIVIGAGVMGLWTGLHLARRGKKTLLIEQFPVPHSRGSSHGQSRIYRLAYPEKHQTLMTKASYPFWKMLERESSEVLMKGFPLLRITEDPNDQIIEECLRSMQQSECEETKTERLTGEEINKRYPGVRFSPNCQGLLDHYGLILLADRCNRAVLGLYQNSGGILIDAAPIVHIEPGRIIKVTDAHQRTYCSQNLVICGGPWAGKLLSKLNYQLPLQPIKIPVIYYRIKGCSPARFSFLGNCAMFGEIFSLPELEYPGMIKFGPHYGPEIDPEQRDSLNMEPIIDCVSCFVRDHFTYLDPTPAIIENCMYTVTPDSICILDTHPVHRNISFGCGFSGAGYKIAPVVGQILADLAMDIPAPPDVRQFMSASRFTQSSIIMKQPQVCTTDDKGTNKDAKVRFRVPPSGQEKPHSRCGQEFPQKRRRRNLASKTETSDKTETEEKRK
ncbi:unnamed protein product [Cyprideis torosa]|uniref:FAD dependent oxidoreductase domain-containing protein n=1 Tax=Cyprideis torosa TaxID=163714 RepID=A0A7R8WHN5_9CRUS|nr:unnamed protein product [Cyprideis torosa]CAG0893451.1 unnamed protein product [Cyprideis torosa]